MAVHEMNALREGGILIWGQEGKSDEEINKSPVGKCRHCGSSLGMSLILCDPCAHKVLDILPCDPKERIAIYDIVIETSTNPVAIWAAKQLRNDAQREVEDRVFGASDIFEERE